MQKISTQSVVGHSSDIKGREDVAPRQKTIDFLRQFARAYQTLGFNERRSDFNALILN